MATQSLNNLFFGEIFDENTASPAYEKLNESDKAKESEFGAKYRLGILDCDVNRKRLL